MEPVFHREAIRQAFINSAPRSYNNLPVGEQSAETVDIFKCRLKTFLFTAAYNLTNEVIKKKSIDVISFWVA